MARPPAKELTERELEIMHVFWDRGEATVADVRDALSRQGLERAYTTVATLVRILHEKGFLRQTNEERPFRYEPQRSRDEVSRNLLAELVDKVFRGSREELVLKLVDSERLSPRERALLKQILEEKAP